MDMIKSILNEAYWIIGFVWAILSVPVTQKIATMKGDLMEEAWYFKVIGTILGFAAWGWLVWPVAVAATWMEGFQSVHPPFDTGLRAKGIVLMLSWMVFTLQLFYRVGFEAGKKSKN